MAPAPPNAASAGDAPRRDASVSPNPLEGPQRLITRDSIPVRTRPFTESSSPIRQQSVRSATEKRQQRPNTNQPCSYIYTAPSNPFSAPAQPRAMAIDQSSTPATGARGRRQFPDGFHHDAQEELLRGAAPVTTRPYLPSSSPTRRPTNAASNGGRRRRHPRKDANPNANYYGVLANEEDEFADAFNALDLETETRKIIIKEKERIITRADVLRTFVESIAAYARKFDYSYAYAIANDFTAWLYGTWQLAQ
ncbi:hypothetical protein NHJ6243_009636 [Beauveria neobassiana]